MNEIMEEFMRKLEELTNKKENDMKGDNYYIGKGILQWDNFFVQISNIAVVSKCREKIVSLKGIIIVILCGCLLFNIQLAFFRIVGAICILFGICLVLLTMKYNKTRKHQVIIKLVSGDRFIIEDRREEFIDQIMLVLQKSITESGKTYNIAMNSGIIQYSDNGSVSTIGDGNWHTIFTAGEEEEEE